MRSRWLLLVGLVAAVGWPTVAESASLTVAPTRIELALDTRSGSVTLENTGDQDTTVQVETFAWNHGNSVEELEPTGSLLAVPAVFNLPRGARQIIRVATRDGLAQDRETAFRLVITEVPPEEEIGAAAVRFALRLSLPVFVTPPGARADPVWELAREGSAPSLSVFNRGAAHLHVRRLVLSDRDTTATLQEIDVPFYILAGRSERWTLDPIVRNSRPLLLEAETNLGNLVVELGG